MGSKSWSLKLEYANRPHFKSISNFAKKSFFEQSKTVEKPLLTVALFSILNDKNTELEKSTFEPTRFSRTIFRMEKSHFQEI